MERLGRRKAGWCPQGGATSRFSNQEGDFEATFHVKSLGTELRPQVWLRVDHHFCRVLPGRISPLAWMVFLLLFCFVLVFLPEESPTGRPACIYCPQRGASQQQKDLEEGGQGSIMEIPLSRATLTQFPFLSIGDRSVSQLAYDSKGADSQEMNT